MSWISQRDVAKLYPTAYAALPSPYQNDSCLDFYRSGGDLWAQPKEDQESVLGDWYVVWNGTEWIHRPGNDHKAKAVIG